MEPRPQLEVILVYRRQQMEPDAQFMEDQPQQMEHDAQFMDYQPQQMEPDAQFMEDQPQQMEPDVQFMEDEPQPLDDPDVQFMEDEPQPLDDPEGPVPQSQPELTILVNSEFLRLLAVLQSDSVSPESRDRNCATAVHFARRYCVPAVYQYLESRNHEWVDAPGCRCVQLFAEISQGCQETATKYKMPYLDLHMAAARLYESIDPERSRENCMHLLHIALRYRMDCVVFYQLGRGVDVLASCDAELNCTALYHAIKAGCFVYVQKLMAADVDMHRRYGADWGTALHVAVEVGFAACVSLLLAEGFEPNARDNQMRTPLHVAALADGCDIARTLIRAGGDLELKDQSGRTPLHAGALKYRISWLLLGEGADVDARTDAGDTALHIAVGGETSEAAKVVRLMVQRGADIFARDDRGECVLHRVRCRAAAECLVEMGADLNAADAHGRTPLHAAFDARRFDVVFALVELGARADVADGDGRYFDDGYRTCAHLEPASQELAEFCKFVSRSMMFGVNLGQMHGPRAIGCCLLFRFNTQSRLELRKIKSKALGPYTLLDICSGRLADPRFVMHPAVRGFFEKKNLRIMFTNYHTHLRSIYKMAVWRNEIMSDREFLRIFSMVVLGRMGLSEEVARMILKHLSLSELVCLKYAYIYR